jgi:CHAT domain-containing protein
MDKFKRVWFLQGALPQGFKPVHLAELQAALKARAKPEQPTGVLFYAYSRLAGQLCVWLIGDSGGIKKAVREVPNDEFDSMRPRLLSALGAVPPGPMRDPQQVSKISADLLPPEILAAVKEWKLTRVIVVPIFDLGEIPFAALRTSDGVFLMDIVRVTVAPGFFVFRDPPRAPSGELDESVVAAFAGTSVQPLHHARSGAEEVKALLGTTAPIWDRKRDAAAQLGPGAAPRFVFIAAHGVSNTQDPVDGGMVEMADGPWNGRDVTFLRDKGGLGSHPIVILSACESGTGKMFEVGSIGLSRAWYYAGAASVVASLWRVDEAATMELTINFVEKARSMPVDEALWGAMKALRDKGNDDPMYWAAFSVFGLP